MTADDKTARDEFDELVRSTVALHMRVARATNWYGLYSELLRHVEKAIDANEPVDALALHEYLRDLKRRYVTDPVRDLISSVPHAKSKAVPDAD